MEPKLNEVTASGSAWSEKRKGKIKRTTLSHRKCRLALEVVDGSTVKKKTGRDNFLIYGSVVDQCRRNVRVYDHGEERIEAKEGSAGFGGDSGRANNGGDKAIYDIL